jgi:hypothetical protein
MRVGEPAGFFGIEQLGTGRTRTDAIESVDARTTVVVPNRLTAHAATHGSRQHGIATFGRAAYHRTFLEGYQGGFERGDVLWNGDAIDLTIAVAAYRDSIGAKIDDEDIAVHRSLIDSEQEI